MATLEEQQNPAADAAKTALDQPVTSPPAKPVETPKPAPAQSSTTPAAPQKPASNQPAGQNTIPSGESKDKKTEEKDGNKEKGFLSKLWDTFAKADPLFKILAGSGVMMSIGKLMDNEEEDNTGEEERKSTEKRSKSAKDRLKKLKTESDTLVSRITSAMQQKDIENRLAGMGTSMKLLAQISIKTQEGLGVILDAIEGVGLAQVRLFNKVKEDLEEANSPGFFESLLPLLVSGLMVSVAAFFIGDKGKNEKGKSFLDIVTDKIVAAVGGTEFVKEKWEEFKKFLEDTAVKKLAQDLFTHIESTKWYKNITSQLEKGLDLNKIISDISSISTSLEGINTNIGGIRDSIDSVLKSLGFISGEGSKPQDNSEQKTGDSLLGKLTKIVGSANSLLSWTGNVAGWADKVADIINFLAEKDTINSLRKILRWVDKPQEFGEWISQSLTNPLTNISTNVVQAILNDSSIQETLKSFLDNVFMPRIQKTIRGLETSVYKLIHTTTGIGEEGIFKSLKDRIERGDITKEEALAEYDAHFGKLEEGIFGKPEELIWRGALENTKKIEPALVPADAPSAEPPKIALDTTVKTVLSTLSREPHGKIMTEEDFSKFAGILQQDREDLRQMLAQVVGSSTIGATAATGAAENVNKVLHDTVSQIKESVTENKNAINEIKQRLNNGLTIGINPRN